MRLWTARCWLVWFAAVGAAFIAGCGGSSSETPEPARPDSWQLKLRHQHQLSAVQNEDPRRTLNRQDSFEEPTTPRSTWGNDGARQRPTAKPASPEALPASEAASAPEAPTASSEPKEGASATATTKAAKPSTASTHAQHPSTNRAPLGATKPAATRPKPKANADAK